MLNSHGAYHGIVNTSKHLFKCPLKCNLFEKKIRLIERVRVKYVPTVLTLCSVRLIYKIKISTFYLGFVLIGKC